MWYDCHSSCKGRVRCTPLVVPEAGLSSAWPSSAVVIVYLSCDQEKGIIVRGNNVINCYHDQAIGMLSLQAMLGENTVIN